jgi:hypothetical protein
LDETSITSWRIFETIFLKKFGEDKKPSTLVLDISRIKMDTNEKVKDFNQCFLSLLKLICWPFTKFWEILGQVELFWDFDSLSKEERKMKQRSWDLNPFLGPFWVFGNM